jgi:hypothetical protein
MGMHHSTYWGFGSKISEDPYKVYIEDFESGGLFHSTLTTYDVDWLLAGDYDDNKLFLTTYMESLEPGQYRRVNPFTLRQGESGWKHNLRMVADEIGMPLLEEPAWFCIPDLS